MQHSGGIKPNLPPFRLNTKNNEKQSAPTPSKDNLKISRKVDLFCQFFAKLNHVADLGWAIMMTESKLNERNGKPIENQIQ